MREPRSARVLIVESFEIMSQGLKCILKDAPGIHLVGEATSLELALSLCCARYPDVVLLDTTLPDLDGVAAVQAIYELQPETKIIALVQPDNDQLIEAILHSTAIGCLTTNVTADELVRSIHRVAASKSVTIRYSVHRRKQLDFTAENLTQREQEILKLLTHGLTNRQIAENLGVSRFTVKNHISALLNKLGAVSRTEAAVFALQHYLVHLD